VRFPLRPALADKLPDFDKLSQVVAPEEISRPLNRFCSGPIDSIAATDRAKTAKFAKSAKNSIRFTDLSLFLAILANLAQAENHPT